MNRPADDGGGAPSVGVDPEGLNRLASQMRSASGSILGAATTLRSELSALGLGTSDAGIVGEVGTWTQDQVTTLVRRRDLAYNIDRIAPWSPGGNLVWFAEADMNTFPTPEAAQRRAAQLAGTLRSELDDGELTDATLDELTRYQNDPYFAVALMTELGPEELTDVAQQLHYQRVEFDRNAMSHTNYAEDREALLADHERLITTLGTTLATASRGAMPPSGSSSPDSYRLPDDYASQLLDQLDVPGRAFGLSNLLSSGNYDTAFLNTIATGVYDHERDSDQSGYWRGLAPDEGNAFVGDGETHQFDPMVGVMQALGRNPEASQDFFYDGGDVGDDSRMDYLLTERAWQRSDSANALGQALESATTVFRDHTGEDSRGHHSAMLASQTIHLLGGEMGGEYWDGMRDSVGNIAAAYITDVDRVVNDGQDGDPGVWTEGHPDLAGTEDFGARFDKQELFAALNHAFGDDEAFRSVTAAHTQLTVELFDVAASSTPPHDPLTRLDTAAQNSAQTFGFLTDAGAIADIDAGKEDDENRAAFLELVDGATGLVPIPGGNLVEFGVGQIKGQVFDQFQTDNEGAAREASNESVDQTRTMINDLTIAAMARHGLLGPGAPNPGVSNPEALYPPGSPGHFVGANGAIVPWQSMDQAQRDAYRNWSRSQAAGEQLSQRRTTVDSAFESGFTEY